MKSFAKLMLLPACALAAILPAGCNNKSYSVYTNMPESSYEICDKSFKLAETIAGYSGENKQLENIDTSAYSAKSRETGYAMSAFAEWVVFDDFSVSGAEQKYNSFNDAVRKKLREIENALSTKNENSDIYLFNSAAAGTKLEIKEITYEVLSEAMHIYDLTGGFYNPALYYNVQEYGFGGAEDYPKTSKELPSDELIAKYTDLAKHFKHLVIEHDGENSKYYITKPMATIEVDGSVLSMKLDLGGIGKGYAVDCVDELFDEYGYKFGYFSFGTSSMLVKSDIKKGEYDLGFSNPRAITKAPYLTTTIRNEKLSSSGDDEQCYFIDGTRYCHIISPVTGKPVQTGIMTASVIGGSAGEADALTTAIMAMEKDDAIKFIKEKLTDRKVVFAAE